MLLIRLAFLLGITLLPFLATPSAYAAAPTCRFVLGFKMLHDSLPKVVGDCLVDEHHNPITGDGFQETTRGLLVWKKSIGWLGFTDGYRTWVETPRGILSRLNTERFQFADYSFVEGDVLGIWNERLGSSILVDWFGRTLYTFDQDVPSLSAPGKRAAPGKIACVGNCSRTWRPYLVSGSPPTPVVDEVFFAYWDGIWFEARPDGSQQMTYAGKPLYFYAGDRQSGDTNGDGTDGRWHVVRQPERRVVVLPTSCCDTAVRLIKR